MSFDARPDRGIHVATIAHVGRIWDAFLEFDGDPHRPDIYRARLRFEPTNASDSEEPTRTAILIIEASYDEAVAKARDFNDRQLSGLLRSALPDEDE